MSRYEHSEVAFDVPREWNDRSIVAFAAPAKPGQATSPNVVMTRDTLGPEENTRMYADRQLTELAKRLERFRLQHRQELTIGDLPAVELRFTWNGSSGPLDQRLLMVGVRGRVLLSFTATAPQNEAAQLQPVFDKIFSTITFPSRDKI